MAGRLVSNCNGTWCPQTTLFSFIASTGLRSAFIVEPVFIFHCISSLLRQPARCLFFSLFMARKAPMNRRSPPSESCGASYRLLYWSGCGSFATCYNCDHFPFANMLWKSTGDGQRDAVEGVSAVFQWKSSTKRKCLRGGDPYLVVYDRLFVMGRLIAALFALLHRDKTLPGL